MAMNQNSKAKNPMSRPSSRFDSSTRSRITTFLGEANPGFQTTNKINQKKKKLINHRFYEN